MVTTEAQMQAIQEAEDIDTGVDTRTKKEMVDDQMAAFSATAKTAAEVAPVIGDAIAVYDLPSDMRQAYELVQQGFSEGDIKDIGLGAGLAGLSALGVVPVLGTGAKIAKKGLRATIDDALVQTGDLFRTASGMDDTGGLVTVTDRSVKISKPPASADKGPTTFKFFGGDKGISSDQKYKDYAASKNKASEKSFDSKTDEEEFIFRDSKGTYVDPADKKFRYEIGTANLNFSGDIYERTGDSIREGPIVQLSFAQLQNKKRKAAIDAGFDAEDGIVLLPDLFENHEIFDEYPFLRNVQVKRAETDDAGQALYDGAFDPGAGLFSRQAILIDTVNNADNFKSILVHEMQHAIDFFEDRQFGADFNRLLKVEMETRGLVDTVDDNTMEGLNKAIRAFNELEKAEKKEIHSIVSKKYSTVAGEVDARNVEFRLRNPNLQFQELPTKFTDEKAPEGKDVEVTKMYEGLDPIQSTSVKTQQAIPVMPINQAGLEARGFDFKPGGEYVNPITKEILTGKKVGNANIKIVPGMEIRGGRPMAEFNVTDLDVPEVGSTGKGKTQILVNLIKPTKKGNKAGWAWDDVESEELEGVNTLVSVVHKGKHYFTLETDFSKGAELKTYPKSQSEPRLRPTAMGEIDLQEQVGTIRMKNKTHPVYRKITAFASGGLAMAKGGAIPMDRQMDMFDDGGLMDEGGTIDPISGNDVPSGSLQKEVRDDIPAQLSEGEFVFPADVVRYIGLEKLMQMRQEAKMALAMMERMGQMGNSEEATMSDDIPFELSDLDITDEPEYNVGGFVPGTPGQQQFGISGFQQAQQPTTGVAAQPVQAASAAFAPPAPVRPQQAFVPTMTQQPTPFTTFIGPGVPQVDYEFGTFKNEAGQTIQLKIKKGSKGELLPGEILPEGYTYVDPDATKTEEVTTTPTTPQTTSVRNQDDTGREDRDAARQKALEDQFGKGGASARLGLKDFFGEGQDYIYGVNYLEGLAPGLLGTGQVLSGNIPDDAKIMLKNGKDEIILTGAEYKIMSEEVKAPGTDYTKTREIIAGARKREAEEARKAIKFGEIRDAEGNIRTVSREEELKDTAEKSARFRSAMKENNLVIDKETGAIKAKAGASEAEKAKAQQAILDYAASMATDDDEDDGPSGTSYSLDSSGSSSSGGTGRGSGFDSQSAPPEERAGGPSSRTGTDRAFSDVGRFGNKGMLVTRKKPKAKKMKRGGLASKK